MSKTTMDDTLTSTQPPIKNEEPIETKKTEPSKVSIELAKLDQMLEAKCDVRYMLSQIYKICILLYRKNALEDKKYSLDKEPELFAEMDNIKSTYNNRGVVAFKIISGGIQFVAGAIGVGGAFATAAQTWAGVSQALGTSAGLPSAISTILGEKSEANRSVYSFMQQTLQKKQEDRKRSSSEDDQKLQQLLSESKQQDKECSEVIRSLLYSSNSS